MMIARRARERTLSGADNQQLRPGDTQRAVSALMGHAVI